MPFGLTPKEPARQIGLDALPPSVMALMQNLMDRMAARSLPVVIGEVERSDARAAWLFGIGRTYDPDDRGIVTNAATARKTWHGYRLAVDFWTHGQTSVGPKTKAAMKEECAALGLTYGGNWTHMNHGEGDAPHVQPGNLPASPTDEDAADYDRGDIAAVQTRYGWVV